MSILLYILEILQSISFTLKIGNVTQVNQIFFAEVNEQLVPEVC